MEIKKREIIFSVVIVAVMLIIGFAISSAIRFNLLEKYQEYDTAVQIDSEDMFRYGMETNIGKAFVYGNLKTIDPVTFSEIGGEYIYIKKVEQEYTVHERSTIDSNGDPAIEQYWDWDDQRTEIKHANKILFLNVEFSYADIPVETSNHITTLSTGDNKRNVYYGNVSELQGTIFTTLKYNTISDTSFYENQTISQAIENLESGYQLVIFWICWISLTVLAVIGFYYLENRWLD